MCDCVFESFGLVSCGVGWITKTNRLQKPSPIGKLAQMLLVWESNEGSNGSITNLCFNDEATSILYAAIHEKEDTWVFLNI